MELTIQIRELRKAKGYTLADLAGKVGVSVPHLSEVERGKKNLNNHLLTRIADALGVKPSDLISQGNRDDLAELIDTVHDLDSDEFARLKAFALALRQSRPDA